jgi:hypothetical protein
MSKQIKNDKPIAVSDGDQAPVVSAEAFMPYGFDEHHETEYSKTLLEKSNLLAASIFNGKEGYEKFTRPWFGFNPSEASEVSVKNAAFFDRVNIDNALASSTGILPYDGAPARTSFKANMRIGELQQKLRRLEKRYEAEEILNLEGRERIISTVLLPDSQFGVSDYSGTQYVSLRYPVQRSVATGNLAEDDVEVLESVMNYLNTLRIIMQPYRPRSEADAGWTVEGLLSPVLPSIDPGAVSVFHTRPEFARKMVDKLKTLQSFFHLTIPYKVREDHIPSARYPTGASSAWMKLTVASGRLRAVSLGYIHDEKTLSELYEAIVEIHHKVMDYLFAQTTEIEVYFQYLNRIGMSFEELVKESAERIKEGDVPW